MGWDGMGHVDTQVYAPGLGPQDKGLSTYSTPGSRASRVCSGLTYLTGMEFQQTLRLVLGMELGSRQGVGVV
jgi:hypothetical protein